MFVTVRAVIKSQVEGYFCSIIYLSEDKEEIRGREREAVCADMHMRTCVRGKLLRIWQWPQCGDVCFIWHLVWLKSAYRYTHAHSHRCVHTANSSSCSNMEARDGAYFQHMALWTRRLLLQDSRTDYECRLENINGCIYLYQKLVC